MPSQRSEPQAEDDNQDEVQFLYQTSPESVVCQVCHKSLNHKTIDERQAHYNNHFNGQPESSTSLNNTPHQTPKDKLTANSSRLSWKRDRHDPAKENIFWRSSQETPPPPNFTPGLIPVLKRALIKAHAKGITTRAALCYEGMVHVATESWDMGWGCGYRNFLMACTALIDQPIQPLYFPQLDTPTPPGVRHLQTWIEDAWKAGFDEEGAAQLNHKLVGTKKWIGTAEIYVAFLSRGIPARLVDFPHVAEGAEAVTEWVERYFTSSPPYDHGINVPQQHKQATVDQALRGASPVLSTDRMPLILQHSGHSRTIIGFEKYKNGNVNLLIMDPSRRPNELVRRAALSVSSSSQASSPTSSRKHTLSPLKLFRRVLHPRHNSLDQETEPSNAKKRRASGSLSRDLQTDTDRGRDVKRVRGGLVDAEVDVIFVDDDDDDDEHNVVHTKDGGSAGRSDSNDRIDPTKVLNFFRLNPKNLGRKDRYQILYFPLEELLTAEEKWARRVVTSERVE